VLRNGVTLMAQILLPTAPQGSKFIPAALATALSSGNQPYLVNGMVEPFRLLAKYVIGLNGAKAARGKHAAGSSPSIALRWLAAIEVTG
jgi:hypothetical protein